MHYVYVKKRQQYQVEAKDLFNDLKENLGLNKLEKIEIIQRYDVNGLKEDVFEKGIHTILSEPMVDDVYVDEKPYKNNEIVFGIEYLKGQYDQRADACEQCYQLLDTSAKPHITCKKIYVLKGELSEKEIEQIKGYLVNPVDQKLSDLDMIDEDNDEIHVKPVNNIDGFIEMNDEELSKFLNDQGMAMNLDDLKLTQDYFKNEEHRNPTETEIKVLDTYWSDHCRHTTFSTIIDNVEIEDGKFKKVFENDFNNYKESVKYVYNADHEITLMNLAIISMKQLRKAGKLDELEVSKEINACSIEITVKKDDGEEQWLLMFKNETHNHPTEIEPFGGAATCLGGAIRDPLSGRSYVYQSMRITGSGNPCVKVEDTIEGKLPQKKICLESAKGFSSYGNQVGLATGQVKEIYDEGFVAKRMELGAVVAAAPKDQVKRLEPEKSDIVLLIGGRTGRDGIGGATGSSKSHEIETTSEAGAEVQKGNPVEERKIQRLFRNKEVSEKIVRCNDFGAGGVAVAVGELADGLDINLDAVLKKYEGLNGTELAISESQERMAVVIRKEDKDFFIKACHEENLEVVEVATVTDENRLVMHHLNKVIVDIDRNFLNKNGACRHQDVYLTLPKFDKTPFDVEVEPTFKEQTNKILSSPMVAMQKGLVERFDSTIGRCTVLSPFGGKTQRTEVEGMCGLIPVQDSETTTCSLMAYGYNPKIGKWSPYHGAMYAVVESLAKIVAMGGDYNKVYFSFQEYFEKLLEDPKKWGKPFSALLGAYHAQQALELASVGGKDSMSGTFEDLDVPPTLVSFAVDYEDVTDIVTPELKGENHKLVEVQIEKDEFGVFNFEQLKDAYNEIISCMRKGQVLSAYTVKDGGMIEALFKMAFGNEVGVDLDENISLKELSEMNYGNIILEVTDDFMFDNKYRVIGRTKAEPCITYKNESIDLDEAYDVITKPLSSLYPMFKKSEDNEEIKHDYVKKCEHKNHADKTYDEVNVVIPVFPGTNCEYDSKDAFEKAGANVKTIIIKNKTEQDIIDSIDELEAEINNAQIVMLAGGFSCGDEPEGSGKFIATFLRNERIKTAIDNLLHKRDGLIIGICNGFQALIKLGLLPDGEIRDMKDDDATLTFNTIGRHVSTMAHTRICSTNSPWLSNVEVGDDFILPVSHGEGRVVAPKEKLNELFENGQVFSQYADDKNEPTMDGRYNPNGSMMAIEGLVSKDGRIIGKMAHSERIGEHLYKNIYGDMDQKIFEAGVKYFK